MQRGVGFALSFIICLASISLAQAQLRTLTVYVDGMACPFCAYGIEKKLKRVEGVKSLYIDINAGTATLRAEEGRSVNLGQVPQAVRDSGFTAREMRVEATGIVRREDARRLLLQYGGAGESFYLEGMDSALRERLIEYAETGQKVSVRGTLKMRPEGWALRPESVEDVSE